MKLTNSPASEGATINGLLPLDTVADMIRAGACLSLAGRKEALERLPRGNWIAGTSPYFMTAEGGSVVDDGQLFVTDLAAMGEVSFASYDESQLDRISGDAPDDGFALAIIPAGSACHASFARDAANYPCAFLRPTVGWIAGYDLGEEGASAWVFDGRDASVHADRVVVAHVSLPDALQPLVEIVNIFSPDGGDVIRFEDGGFSPEFCVVNGERRNFAEYIHARGREAGDLPLVGDYAGAHVNASLKSVDAEGGKVELYAPVFAGIDYRFAAPMADYAGQFRSALEARDFADGLWSCNCILNFLFGELEGVAIGGMAGPVTFGEIAYQLLNQTMVVVRAV